MMTKRTLAAFGAMTLIAAAALASACAAREAAEPANKDGVTIVVLGSSTPAGKDLYKIFKQPREQDPALSEKYGWVGLFGAHIKSLNPANKVVNLALPGYSTARAANDRQGAVDYKHSLDYALTQYPHADSIIISFPALRAQENETAQSAIADLEAMKKRAEAAGVGEVFITTAQPAKNKGLCYYRGKPGRCPKGVTIFDTRVALSNAVIANFPDSYLDFYSPLSKGGKIGAVQNNDLMNPADYLHPNVAGHKALADAVISAGVYERVLAAKNRQ